MLRRAYCDAHATRIWALRRAPCFKILKIIRKKLIFLNRIFGLSMIILNVATLPCNTVSCFCPSELELSFFIASEGHHCLYTVQYCVPASKNILNFEFGLYLSASDLVQDDSSRST